MKNKIITVFLLISLMLPQLYAQVFVSDVSKKGTTAAPFLSIGQSARAIGMGSAFVGVVNDVSSIYWNPAGLTKTKGVSVMFDHTMWIADIKYNYFAASYNLGDMGTVGFSYTGSDIGEMKVTTINSPGGTGEMFSANQGAFSIAYAIQLTENFSIGFNPKFIYESIWRMNASAFAMDLGVQYVTPFDGAVLAMSISNFGTSMQLLGNSNLVLHDLDPGSTGNNGDIPAYLETNSWSLPLNFRVGLAYNPVYTEEHKLTVALDAMHPSDNYESVNFGAEYAYNDFVFIRGGYKSLFLQDSEETFSLGFGLRQQLVGNVALKLDYAYQDFGRFSDIQKFTLSISF
ncbi:MAG: PorV/PorQ family protein [Ignavibacteriaceae bacterium]|jgi:opacity protein-like surface antigen